MSENENNETNEISSTEEVNGEGTQSTSLESLTDEKPEFLPADCWDDETKQVKTDVLLQAFEQETKRVNGLRTKLAKGGDKAPETPDAYNFELDEGVQIQDGDAMLDAFKKVAHQAGLSNERANTILNEFIKATGGFAVNTEPTKEEIEMAKAEEMEKLGDNAAQVVRAVNSWGKEMIAQGIWSEDDLIAIEEVATTANVVIALNKLRSVMGGSDIPTTDAINDGLPSDKEIFQIMQSKKYQDGDEATVRKVDNYLSLRQKAGRPIYLQV